MKGIIAYDHELKAIKSNSLGLMIRPVAGISHSEIKKGEQQTAIHLEFDNADTPLKMWTISFPYPPGTQVFIKETFWQVGEHVQSHPEDDEWRVWHGQSIYHYHADGLPKVKGANGWGMEPGSHGNKGWIPYEGKYYWRKHPSIHMKEEHARFKPFIQSVSVKRIQEITEEEAKAWGIKIAFEEAFGFGPNTIKRKFQSECGQLWPGAYEANKFCWIISIDNNSK